MPPISVFYSDFIVLILLSPTVFRPVLGVDQWFSNCCMVTIVQIRWLSLLVTPMGKNLITKYSQLIAAQTNNEKNIHNICKLLFVLYKS